MNCSVNNAMFTDADGYLNEVETSIDNQSFPSMATSHNPLAGKFHSSC